MTARARRRISYAEAGFFACQLPVVLLVFPPEWQVPYLQFVSIYAVVRTAIAGAQADTPDDEGRR